jgi:hypothetical protein
MNTSGMTGRRDLMLRKCQKSACGSSRRLAPQKPWLDRLLPLWSRLFAGAKHVKAPPFARATGAPAKLHLERKAGGSGSGTPSAQGSQSTAGQSTEKKESGWFCQNHWPGGERLKGRGVGRICVAAPLSSPNVKSGLGLPIEQETLGFGMRSRSQVRARSVRHGENSCPERSLAIKTTARACDLRQGSPTLRSPGKNSGALL